MPYEENQAREYQSIQSHNNSLGQQSWVAFTIIITISILVMAQVVLNLLLTSYPVEGYLKLIIVLIISVLLIFILQTFRRWNKRINYLVFLNNDRMREIESALSLQKGWRVFGLDLLRRSERDPKAKEEWLLLPESQRKYIEELNHRLEANLGHNTAWGYQQPTARGLLTFDHIVQLLIAVWGLVIVAEFLIYFCPAMQDFLF
jgi:hypothetical protein